jgi:hypothetical protein
MSWGVPLRGVCPAAEERGSFQNMAAPEKREVHRETLTCCYAKKCPELVVFDDGSAELSDNDPEIGSVGTIKLRPEVSARLAEILTRK